MTFVIGDRVRLTRDYHSMPTLEVGTPGVIVAVSERGTYEEKYSLVHVRFEGHKDLIWVGVNNIEHRPLNPPR